MTVFLCSNCFDGILCGIYDAYASKLDLENCRLEMADEYELELFAEYRDVPVAAWKAERVARKIRSFMSEEAYVHIYRAALHHSAKRADWIFRFVILGLKHGRNVVHMLQEPAVYEIFQMDRYVGREAHFHRELIRFERLSSGVYYCKVGPVNQVLELVADHFADRFPDMNWIIYDEVHKMAAIHVSTGDWVIHRDVTQQMIECMTEQKERDVYIDLWKTFFHTIAIEERRNERCQRTMLPLRYRKYMTEFQD